MPTVAEVCRFLDRFAPPELAESWDNVGLLVGRAERDVSSVMTCLSVTPETAREAVEGGAELIITHHPFPFRPLNRINGDSTVGRLLLQLIEAGIAVYSPHTAFDSAHEGINRWLSEMIGIAEPRPLVPRDAGGDLGTGRIGELHQPRPLAELARQLKLALGQERVQVVGGSEQSIRRVAVGCGSAGELLEPAILSRCDLFVTGEARFHTCLEAQAQQIALILVGHYASERFALDRLAPILSDQFPGLSVWASRAERDPLTWI